MARDFSVIDNYLREIWDLIADFDRLDDAYDWMSHHFHDPKYDVEFKARKDRFRVLRDEAWRWLKENHFEPQPHRDYERGEDSTADCPLNWEAEVRRLRGEVINAKADLRFQDRQAERQAGLAVAPNLYLINTSDT